MVYWSCLSWICGDAAGHGTGVEGWVRSHTAGSERRGSPLTVLHWAPPSRVHHLLVNIQPGQQSIIHKHWGYTISKL